MNLFSQEIVLGHSAAFKGPIQFIGKEIKLGLEGYFKDKNIKLISKDDRYEPKNTIDNTNYFIKKNVTALLGYVGTPTSNAIIKLTNKNKKIFFGAFSGAPNLSDYKKNPYSFSVRASYCDETDKMVESFISSGIKKIAILYQKDEFGDIGKSCLQASLKRYNLKIESEGKYRRNTIAVKRGADSILSSNVEGIVVVGPYKPSAIAIRYWRSKNLNVPVITFSFVGSKIFSKFLKGKTEKVYVTQVVPNPWDSSIKIVKEYQSKIKKDFSSVSLEGYISAKIFYMALKASSKNVNDSDILKKSIEQLGHFDVGGFSGSFSPTDHRASSKVYLSRIRGDGTIEYVNSL